MVKFDSVVAEQLAEAAIFAAYFSGSKASLSTPHLYISALATWPQNAEPCRGWRSRFPGIPRFSNASRRGTLVMIIALSGEGYAVAFSPDGRRIVSGSSDKSVRVWDSSTGEVQNVLEGHTDLVQSVAFSPDGRCIVSGSSDKSVWVWVSSTGEVQNVLEGHMYSVRSVAFSPDGRYIVSGSKDNSVWVWDLSTGEVQNVLEGHTDSVLSVAFSPDGRRIVSGSEDKSVRVWDSSMGEVQNVFEVHSVGVSDIFFERLAPPYIREKSAIFAHEHEHTGWLVSPHGGGYLMFVPLDERLPDAANILTIPCSISAHVNFTTSTLGLRWLDCYSP